MTEPIAHPTPTRGVPVQLDRVRHLRYTLGTVERLQKEVGEDAFAQAATSTSYDQIAKMLWYGLAHEDPTLTPEAVKEMVDLEHIADILEALAKATGQKSFSMAQVVSPPTPPAAQADAAGEEGQP